jgi:hypothetical protein
VLRYVADRIERGDFMITAERRRNEVKPGHE